MSQPMTAQNLESLPRPTRWYRVEKASSIAAELESSEESGWTYIVIPDDDELDEYAAIALFDSKGEFVTYWNDNELD